MKTYRDLVIEKFTPYGQKVVDLALNEAKALLECNSASKLSTQDFLSILQQRVNRKLEKTCIQFCPLWGVIHEKKSDCTDCRFLHLANGKDLNPDSRRVLLNMHAIDDVDPNVSANFVDCHEQTHEAILRELFIIIYSVDVYSGSETAMKDAAEALAQHYKRCPDCKKAGSFEDLLQKFSEFQDPELERHKTVTDLLKKIRSAKRSGL